MKSRMGFVALIIKLGAKAVKGVKVGLAGVSMASYAYIYTWKFSALIMLMLFVHESGHIWAMKRYGMRTKGIYFLPFVGGADKFKYSARRAAILKEYGPRIKTPARRHLCTCER